MKYIIRKINDNQHRIILPPAPEEILDSNFDYSNYVEKVLNTKVDSSALEDIYHNTPENITPDITKIERLFNNFENKIIKIQSTYENDLNAGTITMDYNEEMKKIAEEYFQKLEALVTYKLQKEKNFQALTAKRAELVSVLKQVLAIKANIENNSNARLHSFINREMPLGQLYLYDLTHIKNTDISKRERQILNKYRRQVFANLISEEGAYTKPIDQLHIKGKK